MSTDPLLQGLADLAAPPPSPLAARLFVDIVEVPGPEPVGPLLAALTGLGVAYLRPAAMAAGFPDEVRRRLGRPVRPAGGAGPGGRLLRALRAGRLGVDDLDLTGLGPFDRDVLAATLTIPAGEVRPYAWVAAAIGRPRAHRAVGSALARNPVPILVPCHRVVRSDGGEGEYLLGRGLKQRLLEHEGVDLAGTRALAARGVHYLGSDTTGVVCFPTCRHARRIGEGHRVAFRSVAEAASAGYRPCRHCRPAAVARPVEPPSLR